MDVALDYYVLHVRKKGDSITSESRLAVVFCKKIGFTRSHQAGSEEQITRRCLGTMFNQGET